MPILTSEKRAEIIEEDECEQLFDTLKVIRESEWLADFLNTLVTRELSEIKAGKHLNPVAVARLLAQSTEELEIQLGTAKRMIEQFPVEAGVKDRPSDKPPKPAPAKKGQVN